MRPIRHAIISAGLASGVGCWFQSWPAAWICLISGVLLDIDHHLDYYLAKRKFPFQYKDLLAYCAHYRDGKMYLVFHSYELLTVLWVAVSCGHLNAVWVALALGVSVHILCDQMVNPLKPLAYSFVYRLHYGFSPDKIFKEGHLDAVL